MNRRALLLAGLTIAAAAACEQGAPAPIATSGPPEHADPLEILTAGNARFARGQMTHPHQSPQRRADLAGGQDPLAIVFSCIDSRVPPEIIFDQGLGDLFVVRTGAQDYDALIEGSIEYGAVMDHTPLMVVLGHQRCGAATAAVKSLEQHTPAPAHLADVVGALQPAYLHAKQSPPKSLDDLIETTIRAQIRLTVNALRADPPLASSTKNNELHIIGAYYSLDNGIVTWLNQ
ncbi:carbonic anhydrase [Mycobacteroides abscessus]|uniref:carbonic anhydrase n=1 Tax=Mycobacteroides abscessus TaxID=36809 RepID=UPI000241C501|nr:carbonic anhydrase [Mycobacteroides abscessus]EHM22023.1 carbonic anhydrase [Mycobacteroides abscessus subsp. massiliense CCUG 48898 = JCM 15300]MDM2402651.1 carbonic anhydrase [Mycobacteroides abscessus]MDM2412969.1 carbonic anhydrase [Mycobacteroides abscessus]ORA88169.1 carbonic anhydrase [Mycobacteroides abscessus subsp. massiliense]BAP95207.1 carbonic anhydrase [Mycobacteroides abscessus subsp. massiliense CCUG 48898 = JCM 15300]